MTPPEPELPLDDIQGVAVPGFLKPHQALLYLAVPKPPSARESFCGVLAHLLRQGKLASGRTTLRDRIRHRRGCPSSEPLLALGFSATGLGRLSQGLQRRVPSPAFQAGIETRAGLLGDPDPSGWHGTFGAPGRRPDALLVVAGSRADAVRNLAERLGDALGVGTERPHVQYGSAFDGAREHFGFVDNVSQPGIRGRRSARASAFITRRFLPPDDPEHDLFGLPGQTLLWPGEFVLGWPGCGPDPRIPGPVRPVPDWMRNGSFLVYRRLRQDVAGFRRWLLEEAGRLQGFPGFDRLDSDQRAARLAATLVGRWPSGAPLARAPRADNPALGRDRLRNNDFRYDDPTPPRRWQDARFPEAAADSLGVRCPVHAHIRKVNVRDQASDVGGTSATQTRRILRVGVPYGDPLSAGVLEDDGADRGLLFLSIQASIEDQFEFLQARWMNSGTLPRAPGGDDLIAGQNGGTRRCRLLGPDLSFSTELTSRQPFVTMTGGGYFFVPSLSTLQALLSGGWV